MRVTLDPERVVEMRERADFFEKAALRTQAVADALHAQGVAFGRKVFLIDVAHALGVSMAVLGKQAAYWHQLGWIELVRLDLRYDPALRAKAEASAIYVMESEYNCIMAR